MTERVPKKTSAKTEIASASHARTSTGIEEFGRPDPNQDLSLFPFYAYSKVEVWPIATAAGHRSMPPNGDEKRRVQTSG